MSSEIRGAYAANGATEVPPRLEQARAQAFRRFGIDLLEHRFDTDSPLIPFRLSSTETFQCLNLFRDDDDLRSFVTGEQIRQALHAVAGESRWRLWQDRMILQDKHAGGRTSWHQDGAYAPYEFDRHICSLWVNLNDGGNEPLLFVVPGSHRWGRQDAMLRGFGERSSGVDLPTAIGAHSVQAQPRTVPFGGMHAHHGAVWHAPNLFDCSAERIAYGMYFIAAEDDSEIWDDDKHPLVIC
nr:phytanoyl-CoA dioxygenase family protein [Nocardia sp.]